ncbi:MAG: ABC transporter substrate-binding protein [Actinomycetota bacterium]|nr:ABC transporter substrate-binding protein [Actinomycetota bacterium]
MNDNLRKWLPWILVAVVAVIIVIIIAVNSGGDDEAATTTTAAQETTTTAAEETTTTAAEETTTTAAEETTTSSSEAPVAFEPIPVKIGTVLPQTGQLAAIIDALENPIKMGVDEMNAVSSGLVSVDYGDSGTDPNIASATVDKYLTGDYAGIIGAAASGVSLSIVDKVQGSEVAMCSGSNTAAAFSSSDYDPYYSRTAPSDNLQGPALADVVAADAPAAVAVLWRNDEYGVGFGELVAAELGDVVVEATAYDPKAGSFATEAQAVVASGADALVMITFEEGGQLLLDLESAGFAGQIYVADGFKDTVGPDQLGGNAALLDGIKGTAPSASPANGEATFPDRLEAAFPGTPTIFSAQKYDCLVVTVLAAQAAQSADPSVFVSEIGNVTKGGEKCTLFEECFNLLAEGKDIDYDGASGPLDFGPSNEPGIGTYDVFLYDDTGATETLEQIVAGG